MPANFVHLFPSAPEVISWALVGLFVGWLAAVLLRGGGYGIAGNIVVGLIGAIAGGMLVGFTVPGRTGHFGSVLVAFLGSCIALTLVRAMGIGKGRSLT